MRGEVGRQNCPGRRKLGGDREARSFSQEESYIEGTPIHAKAKVPSPVRPRSSRQVLGRYGMCPAGMVAEACL